MVLKITGHGTISGETFRFDLGNDGLAAGREYAEMHAGMTLDHRQGNSHWALMFWPIRRCTDQCYNSRLLF